MTSNPVREFERDSIRIERAVERVASLISAGVEISDLDFGDMDAVVAWTRKHPLAGQHCPCENSHCPHHDIDRGEGCHNRAEGDRIGTDPIMLYLGPCCRPCAEALAGQAPEYVMPPFGTCAQYIG